MGKRRISRQALARFRERGHKAFLQGSYNEAIEEWEKVKEAKPSMLPTATLAEVYFRRGITRFYSDGKDEKALEDLQQAINLLPNEPRYHYHLGLMLHHRGDPDRAIPHYRKAQTGDASLTERSAYPLALALLQAGEAPEEDDVWANLSSEEQAMLQEATTFNRRPYSLSEDAPPFWQGMAALDDGDFVQAEGHFKKGLEKTRSQVEAALIHYYLGVLAAQRDDMKEARHQWTQAAAEGLETDALTLNLGESFHRLAEARLEADDPKGALAAAEEALRHKPDQRSLQFLVSQAHQRLGYQAAKRGEWASAEKHWREAYELEDGNFRLAFNLALCYEREEAYVAAGETWREVLRRRPRLEDDPDALDDEQVAQIWKRAAEAYVKAGDYDEAVHVYRQAVKYNPDHLSTRMDLVDSLMTNGQVTAAENELERVLDKAPDYVPALVQMGDVVASRSSWWWGDDPTRYWKRALEVAPNNVEARDALIDYYHDKADRQAYWGHPDAALELYEEILTFAPHHGLTLAAMGQAYLESDQQEEAWKYFRQALTYEATLDRYFGIIIVCCAYGEEAWAWELISEAEANLEVPLAFYVEIILRCVEVNREDLVDPWIERLVDKAGPGDDPLTLVGEALALTPAYELAQSLLDQAQEAGENPARIHMALALVSLRQGDRGQARRHLHEAETLARRQNDKELLKRIQSAKDTLLSMPPGFIEMVLNQPGGPGGPIPFPDFF